ncbi:MAG: CDP-alcohol phosphatidyltransferase family protein, partial [Subdoligranulum sp.]
DGYIARRFHRISNLGKILNPVADKLTQAAMLYCQLSGYRKHAGAYQGLQSASA